MGAWASDSALRLRRGDFVRLCYRLGHAELTGVLSVHLDEGASDLLILRRGKVFARDQDQAGRKIRHRLERLAGADSTAHFDDGLAAYPPSLGRPFSLTLWAREHLERQLDSVRAQDLVSELSGLRLSIRDDRQPHPSILDATDWRILQALSRPRRLDQIWPVARAPRFRLLTFLHFLRAIDALEEHGVAANRVPPIGSSARRARALQTLGLPPGCGPSAVKQAYRRLARELHPDLRSNLSSTERSSYERRLADVNDAYRELTYSA